jgi:gamma-glutamyltranspeptidase/glutathione hydrolase
MSPVMVFDADGGLRLVLGARGGSRIIGHVVRTLVSVLDWGFEVEHAIALPNFVHRGESLEIEAGSPLLRHRGALEQLGHTVTEATMASGLHAIERTPEGWRGGADPRQDGVAGGQ